MRSTPVHVSIEATPVATQGETLAAVQELRFDADFAEHRPS
jgi:hypothetical protein